MTPRPYGFSPYAYTGYMQTPERIPMPSTPYVAPRRQVSRRSSSPQTAMGPIIKNPFVLPENERPARLTDGRPAPQTDVPAPAPAASTAQIDLDR